VVSLHDFRRRSQIKTRTALAAGRYRQWKERVGKRMCRGPSSGLKIRLIPRAFASGLKLRPPRAGPPPEPILPQPVSCRAAALHQRRHALSVPAIGPPSTTSICSMLRDDGKWNVDSDRGAKQHQPERRGGVSDDGRAGGKQPTVILAGADPGLVAWIRMKRRSMWSGAGRLRRPLP